jgi:hypothetical protein
MNLVFGMAVQVRAVSELAQSGTAASTELLFVPASRAAVASALLPASLGVSTGLVASLVAGALPLVLLVAAGSLGAHAAAVANAAKVPAKIGANTDVRGLLIVLFMF